MNPIKNNNFFFMLENLRKKKQKIEKDLTENNKHGFQIKI